MKTKAGYSWLAEAWQLPVLDLRMESYIDSAVRGRKIQDLGILKHELFETRYRPDDTLVGHLQFALRYEGINLQLLSVLFSTAAVETPLGEWLQDNPTSGYARRACFLYEWLTDSRLPLEDPVSTKMGYVDALDSDMQFPGVPIKALRFRVNNNLPGTWQFCPLVRKTPYLIDMAKRDLRQRARDTLASYDQDLLRRAAAFLYLKETQSSFEVEREKPSINRAERFADLLRQANTGLPLTEERLVELQQAVVDPRFHEFCWRHEQNWIGDDLGYRKRIVFVPPKPDDVPDLMQGLLDMADRARAFDDSDANGEVDPVVLAAMIAFGFVFIHPFMDGNGRIHRYLIHEVLANAGFTPQGIVLPVSAVILANLDEYLATLEDFSKPLRELTHYLPGANQPATGNDAIYFRYFDATAQAEFLYSVLARTIDEDLQQEVQFLLGFDSACRELNQLLDWPGHSLELFVRVVHQNDGVLSKTKRQSHFDWMTEQEIKAAETIVAQAFAV